MVHRRGCIPPDALSPVREPIRAASTTGALNATINTEDQTQSSDDAPTGHVSRHTEGSLRVRGEIGGAGTPLPRGFRELVTGFVRRGPRLQPPPMRARRMNHTGRVSGTWPKFSVGFCHSFHPLPSPSLEQSRTQQGAFATRCGTKTSGVGEIDPAGYLPPGPS